MLFNVSYTIFTLLILIVFAFSIGLILPLLGKSIFRTDNQNIFAQGFKSLKPRMGYIASFGVGVLLTGIVAYNANPYRMAKWNNDYRALTFGHLIIDDKKAMQTGKIPKKILDWYANNSDWNVKNFNQ